MTYTLSKGTYFIGDPAYIIRKTDKGDQFIKKLWDLFYEDMNKFHKIELDGVLLYLMRTEGGDGIFDGVGTDTGVFMIVEISQLNDEDIFKQSIEPRGCKIITLNEEKTVEVINFNLEIKGVLKIKTH